MAIRIGIDTGGTFTDLVALDEDSGDVMVVKRPSTPEAPSDAIFDALEHSRIPADEIGYFVLGTTVGVNALLQRKGARVLYVTTAGFEDVPFLQRVDRKFHYDLDWERPQPLVERRDCLGVIERLDYTGAVVDPLTAEGLARFGRELRARMDDGANGAVAVAVNCLFSYVKPDHERTIRDYLTREFPELPVSVSHEVAPIWREYDRASTTIADAYIRPLLQGFIGALGEGLAARGTTRSWAVMKSNGGQMLAESAADRPAQTVLSGLPGGIIAAKYYAESLRDDNIISFDMGGTSTDVGVVDDGAIGYTTAWEIEFGLPVAAPFIEMTTMGAGGGSIAWVNRGGCSRLGRRAPAPSRARFAMRRAAPSPRSPMPTWCSAGSIPRTSWAVRCDSTPTSPIERSPASATSLGSVRKRRPRPYWISPSRTSRKPCGCLPCAAGLTRVGSAWWPSAAPGRCMRRPSRRSSGRVGC